MITCLDCGREVPESNLTLHQLRACSARARRPGDENADEAEAEKLADLDEASHSKRVEQPSSPPSAMDVDESTSSLLEESPVSLDGGVEVKAAASAAKAADATKEAAEKAIDATKDAANKAVDKAAEAAGAAPKPAEPAPAAPQQ